MAAAPIFATTPNITLTQFTDADTTTAKTVFTAGSSGSRLEALWVTSDDTVARDILVYFSLSGTDYLFERVTIAASAAGRLETYINVLDYSRFTHLDSASPSMLLKTGMTIKVGIGATMTAAKKINVIAQAGDY